MIMIKKEKSCGAVIYKYENNNIYILLLKHNLGHWSFPKGHMEIGESEIDTALREVKEETNIDVDIDINFRVKITYSPFENVIKDVIYYVATPKSKEIKPQLSEIQEIKWYLAKDAGDVITYKNDKEVLEKALVYIKGL